ncbi:DUF3324 domain-containing protein [Pimelobacter sp. 30-1]|uniref:DUF3324 domain-containing protein n=1 Tax=Pimelobacter sp. 30-1 TaxID=2004991 RepID=UPI001C03A916|nr:DUF3324 domain-containing protein [Pimelobacter sp. 30-1]MBU2695937.1 hypothetical protein [Pimelobacter sp. 30-1]
MRRILTLLCAAALGVSVLGGVPAAALALEPTWLSVSSADPLLNENGDGYWESATVSVSTDADAAHWTLTAGGKVVGEADLTTAQLASARTSVDLPIDSATIGAPLAAGTYTFRVTATARGKTPATEHTEIYVSTAPLLASLTPDAAVIYPRDVHPGVAHAASLRHGLDATILKHGTNTFEVVGDEGALGSWIIDPRDSRLRWDGLTSDGSAPAGTYRVRLVVADDRGTRYGPLSRPFRLSSGYRVSQELTVTKKANATRTATLTQRNARVRIANGSLHYRALNTDWRREPLVRTAHRVRVPRDRVAGTQVFVVVRGRWQWPQDPDAEIVTPDGRVRNIDLFAALNKRSMILSIPPRLIHPDGTVRFRLLWSSLGVTGDPHRAGRTDTVGVRVSTYEWHDLD